MDAALRRERLHQFEERCRERGLALTVQRRVIFETALDHVDHPTADQLYDRVKKLLPGVSRTTVYRVLETLVELGVLAKACSPGVATRFDPITDRHHHLVCLSCDKLIDLGDDDFRHRVELPAAGKHSFQITDFSIHFHGICAACRRSRSASARTTPGDGHKRATGKQRSRVSKAPKRRTRK